MKKQRPDIALLVCWSLIAIFLLSAVIFLFFRLTTVSPTALSESHHPASTSSAAPSVIPSVTPSAAPASASPSPSPSDSGYWSKSFRLIPVVAEHTIVYVTPYGEHYHRSGCPHLSGHKSTSCTLKEAISNGYTPCSNVFG